MVQSQIYPTSFPHATKSFTPRSIHANAIRRSVKGGAPSPSHARMYQGPQITGASTTAQRESTRQRYSPQVAQNPPTASTSARLDRVRSLTTTQRIQRSCPRGTRLCAHRARTGACWGACVCAGDTPVAYPSPGRNLRMCASWPVCRLCAWE
jgi:hypothetical protein